MCDHQHGRRAIAMGCEQPKGSRWIPHRLPPEEIERDEGAQWILERGGNLKSFTIDTTNLSDDQERELFGLLNTLSGDLTDEEKDRLAKLLATCPRTTAAGIDIDGGKDWPLEDQTAAITAITDAVIAELVRMGVEHVVCTSSGDPKGGRHIEFATIPIERACPEVPARAMRAYADVAIRAGLMPQPGTTSHRGIPSFYVLPEHAELGHAPARLDLSFVGRYPTSRGAMFRSIGGWHKSGLRKKTVIARHHDGDRMTFDPRMLGDAPAKPAKPRRRRPKNDGERFAPLAISSKKLGSLTRAIQRIDPGRGNRHELRMALCGIALKRRIGTKAEWIQAIGIGLKDRADARAAWYTTASRHRAGQPIYGMGKFRELVTTTEKCLIFAAALADITGAALTDVMGRLGRPTAAQEDLDALRPHLKDARQLNRLHKAGHCMHFSCIENCGTCNDPQRESSLHCDMRCLCQHCSLRYVAGYERVTRKGKEWPDTIYSIGIVEGPDRGALIDLTTRSQKDAPEGTRALRFDTPLADGRYRITMICPADESGAAFTRSLCRSRIGEGVTATFVRRAPKKKAVATAIYTMLLHDSVILDAVRKDPKRGAALIEEYYCARRVFGAKTARLPWPTTTQLAAKRSEHVEAQRVKGHETCVSDDVWPPTYDVRHEPTKQVIITGLDYQPSLTEVLAKVAHNPLMIAAPDTEERWSGDADPPPDEPWMPPDAEERWAAYEIAHALE